MSWDELHTKLRTNAMAGKDKKRLDFMLLETVDITKVDKETVLDMLFTTCEYHAVAYGVTEEEATNQVYSNILYIAGYYGEKEAEMWRILIHEQKGLDK